MVVIFKSAQFYREFILPPLKPLNWGFLLSGDWKMVTRADFQAVALDIQGTFSDFFLPRVFTLPGSFDPITEQETGGATETVGAVREEYKARQIDGQAIQSRDFKLIALVNDFTVINPKTDGLKVNVDGVDCQVIHAGKDAADAAWIIQVRGL